MLLLLPEALKIRRRFLVLLLSRFLRQIKIRQPYQGRKYIQNQDDNISGCFGSVHINKNRRKHAKTKQITKRIYLYAKPFFLLSSLYPPCYSSIEHINNAGSHHNTPARGESSLLWRGRFPTYQAQGLYRLKPPTSYNIRPKMIPPRM